MGVLVILSLLLLVATPGGWHAAATAAGAEKAKMPSYSSASEVTSYWKTMLPNSPIPMAIFDHMMTPPTGEEKNPIFLVYGPHSKEDDKETSTNVKQGNSHPRHIYGNYALAYITTDEEKNLFFIVYTQNSKGVDKETTVNVKQEGHHHSAGHNHGDFDFTNLLFSEDVLAPGTMVSPCIPPATTSAPFLRREDADAIPVSTRNFTDILAMFAPASLAMASDIRSTLRTCEHTHLVEGERQACVTSVESMVEFAASVIGGGTTRGLRALSSPHDVPGEGVVAGTRRYTVLGARRLTNSAWTGEEEISMTCHGMAFPYALFYCHSLKATRVYEVTLRDEDAAPMRAHAVCHLDTSKFDPEIPFFVERGLKPGDASVCHFVSRDSVLWTRAAPAKGNARALARWGHAGDAGAAPARLI